MKPAFFLLAVLFVLPACGDPNAGQKAVETPAVVKPSVREVAKKNWDALRDRVKNAEAREEAALNALKECSELFQKVKELHAANNPEYKVHLAKAKGLYEKANEVYDLLQEEAEAIDKGLWAAKFKSFTTQWQKYSSKELSRGLFALK
jgi:hypothetical protein